MDGDGNTRERLYPNVKYNYAYFPVVFEEKAFGATREEVFDALAEQGIGARKYFYPLTPELSCYRGRFSSAGLDVAKSLAARVLTLPIYEGLTDEEIDRITDMIRAV